MKRIFSLVLAIAFSFVLAVPSFIVPASAVGPSDAFIASALISFIGSTGIQMWRANLDDYPDPTSIVINDIKTLWGYYYQHASNPLSGQYVPTWEEAAGIADQGLSVNNGNFILSYDLCQTYQGFVDWMSKQYNFKPNEEYSLIAGTADALYFTLPSDERQGLTYLNSGVWALPAAADYQARIITSGSGRKYIYSAEGDDSFLIAYRDMSQQNMNLYGISLNNSSRITREGYKVSDNSFLGTTTYNIDQSGLLDNVARPNDGTKFRFYNKYITSYSSSDVSEYTLPYNEAQHVNTSAYFYEMAYVVLAGDLVGTAGDLFCSVGNIVANRVYDLIAPVIDETTGDVVTPGQSLSIDIGAGTEAGADDLVRDVVGAIADGALQINAIPEVMSGALELYPAAEDITLVVGENVLSFGDLGRALTTRFPFCIPWDLAYLVESFRVPEKPINVRIDIIPDSWKQRWNITGDTSFPMDLTGPEWYLFRQMMAWALIIGVIGELALLTRNFVNNLST